MHALRWQGRQRIENGQSFGESSKMDQEAVEAAISSSEGWGRTVDNWLLICVAGIAIFSAAAVVFSVSHWLNEKRLRPLKAQQAAFHTEELVKLRQSADESNYRAAKGELAQKFKEPRALTAAQQSRIADRLRQFSGT